MPAPISFNRHSNERRDSSYSYSSYPGSYSGLHLGSPGTFSRGDESMPFKDGIDQCLPQLEANFCKDFSCCGLTLDDLHHLLQHYEDHHVRVEDDLDITPVQSDTLHADSREARQRLSLEAMKRRALLDMQYHLGQPDISTAVITDEDEVAFDVHSFYNETSSRKRAWRDSVHAPAVATRDFFSPAPSQTSTPESSVPSTPILGVQHEFSGEADNPLLFGPPTNSADWLYRDGSPTMPQVKKVKSTILHSGYTTPEMLSPQVIEHPGSNLVVVDKPYKCPVPGCDKAYKNQNGLKYHKMHGNCASNPTAFAIAQATGQAVTHVVHENKPYSCTSCSKRYKNLNGLKYHTAHSHQHVTTDSVLKAIQDSANTPSSWA